MTINPGPAAHFFRLTQAGVVLLLVGCQRQEITVYRIPKETNQVVVGKLSSAEPMSMSDTRPEIRWSGLPAGWKEVQASSMRVASFVIDGSDGHTAEVSVTPLRGASDIEMGSVNIWRRELGLDPLSAEARVGETVQVGDTTGTLYDLSGLKEGENVRILGAVLQRAGVAWFFKMIGSDALVAQQKAAFNDFLKSVSFVEVGRAMAAHPSAGAPSKPAWEVPAHWQEQPPKAMLLAVFTATNDSGKAEATVSALARDGGGLLPNVNRWRGQIGLEPVAEADIAKLTSPVEINGEKGTVVDMTNEANGNRMSAILLPHAGMTWFFKLTGPDAVVAKEKPAFIKFVQSVRFPGNA